MGALSFPGYRSAVTALDELALLLRPAAGGLYVVSTGLAEQVAIQRRLYRARSDEDVERRWREQLAALPRARAILLGIPSDVGAGYLRGANQGPQAIRERLLDEDPEWFQRAAGRGLVDLGDVFVVPQLLHDEMLSAAQLDATRRAIYPGLAPADASRMPVSPLSMAERALELALRVNPGLKVLALGGDHSTAWPVVKALAPARPGLAVVQIDAHTDLLEQRLGVKYCFGTWSFHANDLVGRGGRMVQVGIRATRRERGHWEQTLGVRQFWASEARSDPEATLAAIEAHLAAVGAREIYFSNDIDGTDDADAEATGTPEPEGLTPDFVAALIARLGRRFTLAAGDVMEVAPALAHTPGGRERTLALAARYARDTADALLAR
jgi:agmatinase